MTADIKLKADLLTELEFEPSVNAAHVGVTAVAGVVIPYRNGRCNAAYFYLCTGWARTRFAGNVQRRRVGQSRRVALCP